MKKIITTSLVVLGLSLFATPASAANLVSNGDFELPVVGTVQNWDIYVGPVSGWNVEWMPGSGDANPAKLELHKGVNGWLPQGGSQHAELDTDWDGPGGNLNGEAASVKIYQDIATTKDCTYTFSFYFSPRPGTGAGDNILKAFWDGVQQGGDITAAGGSQTSWTQYSFNVVATGATTRIQFEDHGTANSLGTFLDTVVAEEVSCPPPPPPPHEGCDTPDCCDITVKVKNTNVSVISNSVSSSANTGGNFAGGGEGGKGGNAGDIKAGKVKNSSTGNGGSGGDAGSGGTVVTGSAVSKSLTKTVTNTNITRVKKGK